MTTTEIFTLLGILLGGNGVINYLIQYHLTKKDKKNKENVLILKTLSLVSYCNLKQEIMALIAKKYATEAERRFLYKMYDNYKEHGWNGDMDALMRTVDELPYLPPED